VTASPAPAGFPASGLPGPGTPVLLRRKIHPGADPAGLSVFCDDRWNLTPGMFEDHLPSTSLNFTSVPDACRHQAKHYVWQLINHDMPQTLRHTHGRRLALRSIAVDFPRITAFLVWLDVRAITRIGDVTGQDLDAFLDDVAGGETPAGTKRGLLMEVLRLWAYRELLPADMQLPAAAPWCGEFPRELLVGPAAPRENRTRRIHQDTMEPLMMWALRFVEVFAGDITGSFGEYLALWSRGGTSRPGKRGESRTGLHKPGELKPEVLAYLDALRRDGGALPGRTRPGGGTEPDWRHLTRIFNSAETTFAQGRRLRAIVDAAGLPAAGTAYLTSPITGLLDGQPWRPDPIGFHEARTLARLLRTACLIVICYLSGMRPGEVLNLERGCLTRDDAANLWMITGRHFKGVRDTDGGKLPEGQQRDDPWTVVEAVARTITVLERLHGHRLLVPVQLHPYSPIGSGSTRPGEGRTSRETPNDIRDFIAWVNQYCQETGRPGDQIPPDPHGPIATSRFRKTLAWHIVRRPRGLVAAAIQYGHVHVQMTLGYSGTYDSGFPDEHAYEEWLYRLERIAADEQQLAGSEHVSGPAADLYRHRVHTAHDRFAGRVLGSIREARDMLANPLLQIYPGRAMTCVLDPAKALCQLHRDQDDARRTPDLDDCRPNCRNIARTDRDITALQARAAELRDLTSDGYLAPSLRSQRERDELSRIETIIRDHQRGAER
jgi:integrase